MFYEMLWTKFVFASKIEMTVAIKKAQRVQYEIKNINQKKGAFVKNVINSSVPKSSGYFLKCQSLQVIKPQFYLNVWRTTYLVLGAIETHDFFFYNLALFWF